MPIQRTTSVAIGIILCTITVYFLLGPEYTPHLNATFWNSQKGALTTNNTINLTEAQLADIHALNPTLSSASPYRQRLALLHPKMPGQGKAPHPHLGIASKIVVIGLERRVDRREHMERIRRAMGLEFEWSNAIDLSDPRVAEILERVRWAREESRKGLESLIPELNFAWSDEVEEMFKHGIPKDPIGIEYADIWSLHDDPRYAQLPPLPKAPVPDTRPPLTHMAGFNITMPTPISLAAVSCWYSHYQVLRSVADGPDESVIVFEDDIDMEFDLEKRAREMWPALPEDWDVVMLVLSGHCQSHEWGHPKLKYTPALHRSTHTMCTHAYAVSKRGARKLVRFLRSERFAYSRPIDHTFIHLGYHELIKIYSVLPAVVLQTKDNPSDIVAGTGGLKTEFLVDSVLERIKMVEKQQDLHSEPAHWEPGKDHLRL
ncbi:glycosyltransferase family 25 domain-containing protein [Rhizoctonia solani AG-1 IA]|uniref:Glycosyltransferase family 25 domain-containing protein n=1 Tax=Thanatephorus cucumeris (strain AG1-IA) TaxID=983506 RepID=L8WUL1_THACA|nr:glycosyltransferase family 25 domain-containing protein [Rhizoctonia solani AG-1 IA]